MNRRSGRMAHGEEFVGETEFYFADFTGLEVGSKLVRQLLGGETVRIKGRFSLEDKGGELRLDADLPPRLLYRRQILAHRG